MSHELQNLISAVKNTKESVPLVVNKFFQHVRWSALKEEFERMCDCQKKAFYTILEKERTK